MGSWGAWCWGVFGLDVKCEEFDKQKNVLRVDINKYIK